MDKRLRFMADLIEPLRVAPGSTVRLNRDHGPGNTGQVTRAQADALLAEGVELLAEYQDRLAAQDTFGVLLVLQGLDASGKDSTIKHVMSGVNPQAVAVRAFKQPSAEELNHDFLWRCQRALPGRGEIGIFNRSHYEEVLVVRVHPDLLAAERLPAQARKPDVWARRYREINDRERYLAGNGIHDHKWFSRLATAAVLVTALRAINPRYPAADPAERDEMARARAELVAEFGLPQPG